jgi:hypothetical protein
MNETVAGMTVPWLPGHEARLVIGGGFGHCGGSFSLAMVAAFLEGGWCCIVGQSICNHYDRKQPGDQALIAASRYRAGLSGILCSTPPWRFAVTLSRLSGPCQRFCLLPFCACLQTGWRDTWKGSGQRIPCQPLQGAEPSGSEQIVSRPVLSGLHHNCQWPADERPSYARAA